VTLGVILGLSAKGRPGCGAGRAAGGVPPGAGTTHPLAKHLEVSGVRIQEASAGKVKIDFNVVNHSSADLPELKLDVRLRSGNRDFFSIPVKLPSLGPYASRDMSTTVKTDLKPYELPDWQRVEPRFTVEDADK